MSNGRFLIIDNRGTIKASLFMALSLNDYEVDVAENPADAMTKISKKLYDLILINCEMPKSEQLELTRKIEADYPEIPSLVVANRKPAFNSE
jgi:DNA-binding NtrC family response regulator